MEGNAYLRHSMGEPTAALVVKQKEKVSARQVRPRQSIATAQECSEPLNVRSWVIVSLTSAVLPRDI